MIQLDPSLVGYPYEDSHPGLWVVRVGPGLWVAATGSIERSAGLRNTARIENAARYSEREARREADTSLLDEFVDAGWRCRDVAEVAPDVAYAHDPEPECEECRGALPRHFTPCSLLEQALRRKLGGAL